MLVRLRAGLKYRKVLLHAMNVNSKKQDPFESTGYSPIVQRSVTFGKGQKPQPLHWGIGISKKRVSPAFQLGCGGHVWFCGMWLAPLGHQHWVPLHYQSVLGISLVPARGSQGQLSHCE